MTIRAFITGLSGLRLSPAEQSFLREARPWGLILFERNISNQRQVSALVAEFRDAAGFDAPVLIDQEGGRVQRLGPPYWRAYPSGSDYGWLFDRDPALGLAAARLGGRLIAADLALLGITVNCLPLGDVPAPGADPVIGTRAYGDTPDKVAQIADAIATGLGEGGVLPVLKVKSLLFNGLSAEAAKRQAPDAPLTAPAWQIRRRFSEARRGHPSARPSRRRRSSMRRRNRSTRGSRP